MDLDRGRLLQELCERMTSVERLPGEKDFFNNPQTLSRFLKARDFDVDEAEKQLKATIEWRRETDPLHVDCRWCHEKPGFHGMRQVGFDESGRPVIYACCAQATQEKLTIEDVVCHSVYLIENAKRTMSQAISSWVFVVDCTGMSLPSCNPKLGYGISQIFSNYYPERLGMIICLHHNPIFHGVWNAIKVFLQPNTVAKMHMIRSKKKVKEMFSRLFSEELSDWMLEEMKLNKERPLSTSQRNFWRRPDDPGRHDPRGCPSYVSSYIEPLAKIDAVTDKDHLPHPNIVDCLRGVIKLKSGSDLAADTATNDVTTNGGVVEDTSSDGEDREETAETLERLNIGEEYQIPNDAKLLGI